MGHRAWEKQCTVGLCLCLLALGRGSSEPWDPPLITVPGPGCNWGRSGLGSSKAPSSGQGVFSVLLASGPVSAQQG